ncbi:MAG: restriction endonuclease subunit S [Candidatus Omnitrophota bacterium]
MQISVVTHSKVKNDSKDFRIDAEFYLPVYLKYEKQIGKHKNEILRNLADNCYKTFRRKEGVFEYIEISNVDLEIGEYYTEILNSDNPPSRAKKILKKSDIIISTVRPNRNAVSIILDERKDLVASTGFCKLTAKRINPKFLFILFKTSVYRDLLVRFTTATMYPAVNEDDILNLRIPIFDDKFQTLIESIVDYSYSFINKSKSFYSQAEQMLLSELGLLSWKPKHRLSFVKNFSDTQASGRIDAEYFQPKYDEVVERIKQYKKGYKSLGEIVRVKNNNFQPKDEVTYRYIELANISANGNINGFIEAQGKELPTRARRMVNAGDVIVSTIEGALSSVALINDDLDNALCSTGFFVVNSEKINSETLLVLFKSPVGQLQLKKGCSGTILTAIGDDEFKRIILPDLFAGIQSDIKRKITEMYDAKALSKRLLDIAKRGVEMAIEKSEKDAQNWIEAESEKLKIATA